MDSFIAHVRTNRPIKGLPWHCYKKKRLISETELEHLNDKIYKYFGETLLTYACRYGAKNCVIQILKYDSLLPAICGRNKNGNNAFAVSILENNFNITTMLMNDYKNHEIIYHGKEMTFVYFILIICPSKERMELIKNEKNISYSMLCHNTNCHVFIKDFYHCISSYELKVTILNDAMKDNNIIFLKEIEETVIQDFHLFIVVIYCYNEYLCDIFCKKYHIQVPLTDLKCNNAIEFFNLIVKNNRIDVLKVLIYHLRGALIYLNFKMMLLSAVTYDRLEILKLLFLHFNHHDNSINFKNAFEFALEEQKFEIVTWFCTSVTSISINFNDLNQACQIATPPFTLKAIASRVFTNSYTIHLYSTDCLITIVECGYLAGLQELALQFNITHSVLFAAIRRNQLDIFIWLIESHFKNTFDTSESFRKELLIMAQNMCAFEICVYLLSYCEFSYLPDDMSSFVSKGRWDLIRLFLSYGSKFKKRRLFSQTELYILSEIVKKFFYSEIYKTMLFQKSVVAISIVIDFLDGFDEINSNFFHQ